MKETHYMRSLLAVLVFFSVCEVCYAAPQKMTTGLPVPRFVSLKSDEANVRTGPGERYPISVVYKRAHWPVEIIEEFDHWRKIRDVEGAEGWVNKALLSGERTALIKDKARVLYDKPEDTSVALLRAKPGVMGALIECQKEWCKLQIASRKGWMKKAWIWGVYKLEEFED